MWKDYLNRAENLVHREATKWGNHLQDWASAAQNSDWAQQFRQWSDAQGSPDSDRTPGQWLYELVEENAVIEREGWAVERAERVVQTLMRGKTGGPFEPVVYWGTLVNAFTLPGRYLFISRPLLDRCPDDETAAFIIAHEIAHHELGHLVDPGWTQAIPGVPGALIKTAARMVTRAVHSAERENEADLHAIERCRAAGYDPHKCLHAFQVLETYAMDRGATELVTGPDMDLDPEINPNRTLFQKWLAWVATHLSGYEPLKDREARCRAAIERPTLPQ